MKVSVTTTGSLVDDAGHRGRPLLAHTISARVRSRLQIELARELQDVLQSERAIGIDLSDPETRRDALERAVRRIWGTAQ
jgi:hypothetical protein